MLRRAEQARRRGLLDDLAGIHHGNVVADLGHHAQVVGDHDDARVGLLAQLDQQVEDLRLDSDVERRGRLVGDQQGGGAGQSHGDHDALAHAARQLVRIFVHAIARGRDPDPVQQVDGGGARVFRRQPPMSAQCLADLVADGEAGIERGHRLLEDHGQPVAAQIAHLPLRQGGQILPLEQNRAGDAHAGLRQQAHDGQGADALAAAGLPHDAQGAAGHKRKAHAADSHRVTAAFAFEDNAQIRNGKKRRRAHS